MSRRQRSMEASSEGGQDTEGAVVTWIDGAWILSEEFNIYFSCLYEHFDTVLREPEIKCN